MVSESPVRSRTPGHKKVSKPLMEKKRRARINTCLDQLRTLLESLHSSDIRKRKLEKADILELTVKHLKHLQKTGKGFPPNCGVAEYQAGYASCLAGVNQYLLMSDADAACRSGVLTQMTRGLLRLGAPLPDFSTADSDSSRAPPARRGRDHSGESKRTQTCEHQTPAHGLLDQRKRAQADRSRGAPTALQQSYWRPW
ncbi:hairy-related 3 [Pygocentrus nattereri]|uniref:hairy-related 3 n=1 Tax=Pygocentrus nattereri TaxID=42514 RepID=UPI001890FC14|nr:hairy-related 3 [Pygocentrus nattereri]